MNERYESRDIITRSGGGMVCRAWDRETKREVVIKRACAEGREAALEREAATLRMLSHPNIVSILDSGCDDEGAFMVMELAEGQTLEAMVARQPLDLMQFEQFVTQTLAGIAAAHALGVLHLDLKPQNIMVAQVADGRLQVKLLDFGIARLVSSSGAAAASNEGSVMGSLFYMAPERFDREPGDARADLYSLGCVYYHALLGRPPFVGDTSPQVMVAHIRHQFRPLAEVRPDLPAFVTGWVEWLISRRPEDRPASATEALAAFREHRTSV